MEFLRVRLSGADLAKLADAPALRGRALAAAAMVRAEYDGAYPARALDGLTRRLRWNDRSDRAAAMERVQGALRWRGPLDARLSARIEGGIASVEPLARQVLRIAAWEMLGPQAGPAHGSVNAAVEIVKRLRGRTTAGFVNAVLRRVAEQRPEAGGLPVEDAAREALPAWLGDRFVAAWGAETAAALARWSLETPVRSLRLNRRRTTAEEALAAFPGSTVSPWSSLCLRLAPGAGDLGSHAFLLEGRASQQEEGAFLVAEHAPIPAGARVLDACAGRGGKTGALAERADDETRFTATDLHERKLRSVAVEFERLGIPPPVVVAADWSKECEDPPGPFDLVFVDAPCTGTGTIARRPEIRWRLGADDVARLAALQDAILARVAPRVAPGGTLVYAVCSLLPEEGAERVARLLEASGGFEPAGPHPSPPFRASGPGAVLLPPDTGTDGFFVAALRRTAGG